jgi:hypothetical protein
MPATMRRMPYYTIKLDMSNYLVTTGARDAYLSELPMAPLGPARMASRLLEVLHVAVAAQAL